MLANLRFALRTFAKSPGFVTVAVLVAALGIGANTAIFSVVRSVILRTLPFHDPDRLVMIWERNPQLNDFLGERSPVRLANLLEWRKTAKSFTGITAYLGDVMTLTGVDRPEELRIGRAPSNFAEIFGIRPRFGRMWGPDEDNVAILNQATFARIFGADPKRLGSSIELNGKRYTVIGVWPPQFHMPAMWQGFDQTEVEVWLPLDTRSNQSKVLLHSPDLDVYARLAPGISLAQARSEMTGISARMAREDPDLNAGFGVNIFTVPEEDLNPSTRRYVLILQGAVGLVLLIACANVANLLLARSMGRRKEMAVRIALGAGAWRLARQTLSESLLLSLAGGAAGLALARAAIRALSAIAPRDTPHLHDFQLDSAGLLFTLAITILTGLIFGLAPSLDAARRNVNDALNQGGRSSSGGISMRLRRVLAAGEVALAVVLMVGAGLLIRTVRAMIAADPGFHRDGLLTLRLTLPRARYPTNQQVVIFDRQLLQKIDALPGVISASMAGGLPTQNLSFRTYSLEDTPARAGAAQPMTSVREVGDTYFQTMIIPLLAGRGFTREEVENPQSSSIVVNESFVRQVFRGADPIGKIIKLGDERHVIVGMVRDAAQLGPDMPIDPEVYIPCDRYLNLSVVVRASADISSALRNAVLSIDRNQPSKTQTLNESLNEFIAEKRFVMELLGAFAGLALLLAAAGIYGVLAYSVSQRTREIGIRMAVGASARDILKLIVSEGLSVAAIGVAIGIAGALALTRLLAGLLFGVSTLDPLTFAIVALSLVAVAILASTIPASRAASLAPLDALRDE